MEAVGKIPGFDRCLKDVLELAALIGEAPDLEEIIDAIHEAALRYAKGEA